jgi:hypothetical protein
VLWVRSTSVSHAYPETAKNVAVRTGLYDVTDGSARNDGTVDGAWSYEASLPAALDALSNPQVELDGILWLTALVPFIAGLFARTPDFRDHYVARLPGVNEALGLTHEQVSNNATNARLIAYQEALAPVMSARWIVVHFAEGSALITSDRAFCVTSSPHERGYAVPLDVRTVLVVVPQPERSILFWTGGNWRADLHHVDASTEEVSSLRRAVAAFARHAIFGPTAESVNEYADSISAAPSLHGELFEPLAADWGCHLYDFFRALSVVCGDPAEAPGRADYIDWDCVERYWKGPVVTEVLFPQRTMGGISVANGQVRIDLSYGIATQAARKAAGDFRTGARAMCSMQEVRRAAKQGLIPPTVASVISNE